MMASMKEYDKLRNIYNLKIFLHKYIYSDISNLKLLLEQSDIFNIIDYNEKSMLFNLKIKKTNIKKKYNYTHNSLFYYNIINDVFRNYLYNLLPKINKIILENNEQTINIQDIEFIINTNIQCLFDITIVADNAIILKL